MAQSDDLSHQIICISCRFRLTGLSCQPFLLADQNMLGRVGRRHVNLIIPSLFIVYPPKHGISTSQRPIQEEKGSSSSGSHVFRRPDCAAPAPERSEWGSIRLLQNKPEPASTKEAGLRNEGLLTLTNPNLQMVLFWAKLPRLDDKISILNSRGWYKK